MRPLCQPKTERAARGVAAAVAFSMLLGACSDLYWDRRETIALGADDAVAANLVTQMVDPWPPHSNNKNLAFNGERMQMGVECYRSNTGTPPADLNTSSASYSGGGAPAQSTKCGPKTNAGAAATPATGAPVK